MRWIYPKTSSITASRVVAWCKVYKGDIYKFKEDRDIKLMCCVNKSPYQKKNCTYFRDKANQTSLGMYGDLNE